MALRTDNNLRAGLYARISTEDRGQDPETQLRPLREYADRRDRRARVLPLRQPRPVRAGADPRARGRRAGGGQAPGPARRAPPPARRGARVAAARAMLAEG